MTTTTLRIVRCCLLTTMCASKVAGSAATFVTALPVATDQLLVRFNAQPFFGTSRFTGVQFPVNIGYGLTSRWALFLNTNEGFGALTGASSSGPASLSSSGVGDTLFFARYTLFRIDKPKSTFRIAPLAGAFIPTGNNALRGEQGLLPQALQTGSGTVHPYFGITTGYNNPRWGMAADTTYRRNAMTNQGISPGSELRSDAQFELRLIPMHLPEEGNPKVLWLSIEANYVQDLRSDVNGNPAVSSGGKSLKQDVILEWTTLHWQLGVGGQIPVMQDLPGVGRIREHSGAFVFFEYYLAAPQRRHGRSRS
jgi:hypothetical protein